MHGRHACAGDMKGVHKLQGSCEHDYANAGIECSTDGFRCDRGFSIATGDGGFHVATRSTVSRHGLAVVGGWVVT